MANKDIEQSLVAVQRGRAAPGQLYFRGSDGAPTGKSIGDGPDQVAAGDHDHEAASPGSDGFLSAGDKSKLDGIAENATANASDAELRDRSTHTGEIEIDAVTGLPEALEGKAPAVHGHAAATELADGFMSAEDKAKLDALADPDALRDRANHTGTQAIDTVEGLPEALEELENSVGGVASVNGLDGAVVLTPAIIGAQRGIYVHPEDFTGADPEEAISLAFATARGEGYPSWLGAFGATYPIGEALPQINLAAGERLDVRGSGAIMIAADIARPIVIASAWPAATAVSALSLTTYTMDNGASATECIRVTSAGHGVVAGDLVKLIADDSIPGEISVDRRVGEWFRVGAVVGNDVYLAGRPIDAYTTGIRLQRVPEDRHFSWDGPSLLHTPGQAWQVNALTLRGLVGGFVKAHIRDGYDCGVQPQSCAMMEFDLGVWDMFNRISSLGISGYGYQDCCGWLNRLRVVGKNARHFGTTGSLTTLAGGASHQFGRTIGARFTGSVMGSTSAAFDFHSSAYDCVIYDAVVTGGSAGEDGGGHAYQLRGWKNRIEHCSANGSAHGIQLYAQTADDGIDLEVNGFTYSGAGDAIRLGAEPGAKLQSPKIRDVSLACSDNLRSIYITRAGLVQISGHVAPTGATSGSNAVTIGTDVDEVWVEDISVDLSHFGGANYDLVAFSAGVTGTRLTVAAPSADDLEARLRSWVNGNGATAVEVDLLGLPEEVVPTGGVTINGAGLTVRQRTGGVTAESVAAAIEAGTSEGAIGTTLIAAIEAADPERLLSRAILLGLLGEIGGDYERDGPILAGAIAEAEASMSEANLKLKFGALYPRMGYDAPVARREGGSEGDVVILGPKDGGGIRILTTAPAEAVTPPAGAFPHVSANRRVEWLAAEAFMGLLEAGLPFGEAPVAPVSGVLTYDPRARRRAYLAAPLVTDLWLNPSLWNSVASRMWEAELAIPIGAADRLLSVGAVTGTYLPPSDGLIVQAGGVEVELPFTMEAGGEYSWLITRRRGGKPLLRLIGVGYAAAVPAPAFLGEATADFGSVGTRTIPAANMPEGIAAGDKIVAIGYNTSSGAPPTFSGFDALAGIGGDGIQGNPVVVSKTALGGGLDSISCATATQLRGLVFKKAGGTPTLQAGVTFNRNPSSGTATATWGPITVTNRGLLVGLHGLLSGDDIGVGPALRAEIGNAAPPPTATNRLYIGVSDLIDAGTVLGGVTTPKSGNTGRSWTAQFVVS